MLRQDEYGEIVACPAPPLDRLHPRLQQGYKIMEKYAKRQKNMNTRYEDGSASKLDSEMLEELKGIY